MPSAVSILPPLSAATSHAEVSACNESCHFDEVKHSLLDACEDILAIESTNTLWKSSNGQRTSNMSLQILYQRLESGKLAPSPLKAHADNPSKLLSTLHVRTGKSAINRPLEDFEDLYYAILAKIKDIHQHISLRINNGFSQIQTTISPSGPTIAQVHTMLESHWATLNDVAIVKTLDSSVRRSRVKHLHLEVLSQLHRSLITPDVANELLVNLYDPVEYDEILGLAWIGGWAPSMIRAWLEEKYRVLLQVEKGESNRKRKAGDMEAGEKMVKEVSRHDEEAEKRRRKDVAKKQYEEILKRWGKHKQDVRWAMKAQRVEQYRSYLKSTVIAGGGVGHSGVVQWTFMEGQQT